MGFTVYLLFLLPTLVLGMWAQHRVSSAYNKWVKVPSRGGISGAEAASAVMRKAGINDVDIVEIGGRLTDHYDPVNKRLCLSRDNYRGTSLAALGVSAHEAGHAIQHKVGYKALQLRMSLVPITQFASQALPILFIGSLFFFGAAAMGLPIKLIVACYAVLTFFQLITLPVEFDASRRAKQELVGLGIIGQDERVGVDKTLDAAAWTYVAAFVTSLVQLIYWIMVSRR